jgi:hypothetical protein
MVVFLVVYAILIGGGKKNFASAGIIIGFMQVQEVSGNVF